MVCQRNIRGSRNTKKSIFFYPRNDHTHQFTCCYVLLILSQRRHHHVESVHFTTSGGKALHHALAVVQTPGREYYILKDNGMQVGCEEDGVAPVWMSVLDCNSLGNV